MPLCSTKITQTKRRRFRAFSLVELVCVLAILVILSLIAESRLSGSRRRTARELCRTHLQEISLALNIYENDNRGNFPAASGATNSAVPLSLLIPRSTTETAMFICPGTKNPELPEGESFAQRRISYAYYMGRSTNSAPTDVLVTDWQLNTAAKTKGQPIFSADGKKPANNHDKDGGNLLLVNGEVIASGPAASTDLSVPAGITLLNPAP